MATGLPILIETAREAGTAVNAMPASGTLILDAKLDVWRPAVYNHVGLS